MIFFLSIRHKHLKQLMFLKTVSTLCLLLQFIVMNWGVSFLSANDIADMDLVKECMNAPDDDAQALGDTGSGQFKLKNYNPKCNHEKLLREAKNLEIVERQVAEAKYKKVSDDLNGPMKESDSVKIRSLLKEYQKDGTCLQAEARHASAQAGADTCLRRLHRLTVDTSLKARNNISKYDRSRLELVSDDKSLQQGAINNAVKARENTVLMDLKRAALKYKQGTKQQQPQQLLNGTRPVVFGNQPIDTSNLSNLGASMVSGEVKEVKTDTISRVNSDVAKRLQSDQIEVLGEEDNEKINEVLKEKRKNDKLKNSYVADLKAIQTDVQSRFVQQQQQGVPQAVPTDGVGQQVFEEVMTSISNKAKSEDDSKGNKGTDDSINRFDANILISAKSRLSTPQRSTASGNAGNSAGPVPTALDDSLFDDIQKMQ